MSKTNITNEVFAAYSGQYDYFNRTLFNGELPDCLLNFSRKGKNNHGFFAPERWSDSEQSDGATFKHEISLNPTTLRNRSQEDITSTLVHEMCHLWQREFGKPGKRGYHNEEWAKKMDEVGLTPSNTGAPGGKRHGIQMTHFVTPDGVFARAFSAMPAELQLPWLGLDPTGTKGPAPTSKFKYTCQCDNKIWGRQGLNLRCEDCQSDFVENPLTSQPVRVNLAASSTT
jgi:predicted SprT family Zn-dependent metalloprotease